MTKDEALKLALEALELEEAQTHYPSQWLLKAITAIKEALAQPEQEPDYNICPTCGGMASDPIVPPEQRQPATVQESVIDKSAAIRIATALGWEPQHTEQKPVAWIDAEKRTFEWNGPVLWNTPTVAALDKIPLYTTPPAAQPAPVQEPVAWQVHPFDYGIGHESVYARTDRPEQVEMWKRKGWTVQPLYTTQPAAQRQWQSLTDEDFENAFQETYIMGDSDLKDFSQVIEAKLKEKNT